MLSASAVSERFSEPPTIRSPASYRLLGFLFGASSWSCCNPLTSEVAPSIAAVSAIRRTLRKRLTGTAKTQEQNEQTYELSRRSLLDVSARRCCLAASS